LRNNNADEVFFGEGGALHESTFRCCFELETTPYKKPWNEI